MVLVGLSFDCMGTLMRVKGGSVGTQYQRLLREAVFAAAGNHLHDEPVASAGGSAGPLAAIAHDTRKKDLLKRQKWVALGERMMNLDSALLNASFKKAFTSVTDDWISGEGATALSRAGVKRPLPVVGGATPLESSLFWRRVIHRAYGGALARHGDVQDMPDVDDPAFITVCEAIFDGFASAEPYELLPEAELCLTSLRKLRVGASKQQSSFVPGSSAMPGATLMSNPTSTKMSVDVLRSQMQRAQDEQGVTIGEASTAASEGQALNPFERAVPSHREKQPSTGIGRVSVVTNFDGRMHRVLSSMNLSIFFDDIITIHEGPRKPSPAGIVRCWSKMDGDVTKVLRSRPRPGLTLSEAIGEATAKSGTAWLHVGDASADAEAAAAAGAKLLRVRDPVLGLTFGELQGALHGLGIDLPKPRFAA